MVKRTRLNVALYTHCLSCCTLWFKGVTIPCERKKLKASGFLVFSAIKSLLFCSCTSTVVTNPPNILSQISLHLAGNFILQSLKHTSHRQQSAPFLLAHESQNKKLRTSLHKNGDCVSVLKICHLSNIYHCKITSTINQQMHLYNFHLKHFKTLKTTPTCFDLFRSS